jgi:hypothetical protein
MKKILCLALIISLTGCSKKVEQQAPAAPRDPNIPDSFSVSKICKDGTKIYLLAGGESSGKYAVWDTGGSGSWEIITDGVTPDQICQSN